MSKILPLERPDVQTVTCGKRLPERPSVYGGAMQRGGKRSNPDYTKITIYMRTEIRRLAGHKLLDTGDDLSEVVNRLVAAWASGNIDLAALPSPKSLPSQ